MKKLLCLLICLGNLIQTLQADEIKPEEKEIIVKRYLSGESTTKLADEFNVSRRRIYYWVKDYEEKGLDGLISNTGKASKRHKNMGLYLRNPKSREEELEIELMKKDIEIARLKKDNNVKGVGQEKEFVTTFNKNTK